MSLYRTCDWVMSMSRIEMIMRREEMDMSRVEV